MATTDSMENHPGFDEPVGGVELALRMKTRPGNLVRKSYDEVIMDLAER